MKALTEQELADVNQRLLSQATWPGSPNDDAHRLSATVALYRSALSEMAARCPECCGSGTIKEGGKHHPCEDCDAARLALQGEDWRDVRTQSAF